MEKGSIAVIILAFNEEKHIERSITNAKQFASGWYTTPNGKTWYFDPSDPQHPAIIGETEINGQSYYFDSGYGGLAVVDNIYALSNTIRGVRHTVSRLARSVNR